MGRVNKPPGGISRVDFCSSLILSQSGRGFRAIFVTGNSIMAARLEARLQLHIHLQYVFLNPLADGFMQRANRIWSKSLLPGVFPELFEKNHELLVGLFVFCTGRTPVAFHAILLEPEMLVGVGFKKVDQINQEITGLLGRIGLGEQALKMIDVVYQHLVVLVNRVRTGFELFAPDQHDGRGNCWNQRGKNSMTLGNVLWPMTLFQTPRLSR
jgi:hypothetical protein